MAFVLAMLAASLAWGEEIAPDAEPALVREPLPELSIERYRAGTRLATTGLVLVPSASEWRWAASVSQSRRNGKSNTCSGWG